VYYINWDEIKPWPELLAKCHKVEVDRFKNSLGDMRRWARKNTSSLIWIEVLDTNDIGSWRGPDDLAIFYFGREHDALLFQLRWV